ncbi:MAG: endopeptidase La [Lachnospiraceae bacterium]|nr:endopeptidase La [Lachnospiraceae bacterium]
MERTELIMPAVALRGMTILPEMITHFDVSRSKSVKAVEKALTQEQRLFIVAQRDPETENPGQDDLFEMGTVVEIKQIVKLPHNILRVLVEGVFRAKLLRLEGEEYLEAVIEESIPEVDDGSLPQSGKEAMFRNLQDVFEHYAEKSRKIGKDVVRQVLDSADLETLIVKVMVHTPLGWEQQQRLLETMDFPENYELLCIILNNEIEIELFRQSIQEKVKARVDKNQKDYILREQMKVIREELGDEGPNAEAEQFRKAVKELPASQEVKDKIEKEIQRFLNAGSNSSEASVIRGYIETLLELPWDKRSEDCLDLNTAKKILEAEHYGLEKVKERVMEFLAVRKMLDKGESPILCLVGPPGTGKTSVARSIAHALDKKYVRICLGGVHDEAEIRGHRRTYIGAMPGRIVDGIRQAGVKNPLMVLDEIDKVSSDHRGDTFSALLEVLDSEQNEKFRDHYVELPVDLSEVMFLCTANDVQTIPRPLLDRMEVIEVSSYTENEKFHIAKDHLLPKQMERHGLKKGQLQIADTAMKKMIHSYTREAGVRNLERRLAAVCRKADREILEKNRKKVKVTDQNLEKYLGKTIYESQLRNEKDEIGIVRGLAWTSVGGSTLEIEVNLMPGRGEFQLTGQIGDVMQESAKAGISYIRSVSKSYGLKKEFFQKHDIHIHIPEGAVPKDGPSAGITMATAMLSAMLEKPVRADVAMTGEITLRGRVLPIGGLKEKLLAAKSADMKTVIVPKKNERDVEELSKEITGGLEIIYAQTMEDVLEHAFAEV